MREVAQGCLEKMFSQLDNPVNYSLVVGDERVELNPLLGKSLQIKFSGKIVCNHCGRSTKKSFSQGFCFPCFRKLARCDSCIMSPEKCHFFAGTCREPEWGETHCMVPHVVYLANSSGIKVGITRKTQTPTRWIDQGAIQALPIMEVTTRRMSGLVEEIFRQSVTDRTNWRAMLKGDPEPLNLVAERDRLLAELEGALEGLRCAEGADNMEILTSAEVVDIAFPVMQYPQKVVSLNPEKEPEISGTLLGIKGQYLILDTGCINIRKFTSYEVSVAA
ncbi:DUF2797 domain-containing protein [Hahella sp. KA22]|uniref:DUF2797 domain-containing protein n=1 Tax=Hahella sp. KA22 TaxID=1628392 RepID=UPI000FDF3AC1|nr:DUF2797 domain-containing protein [Hahella sp. KA22]AZZ91495.1 DUF2797 domain-containing protein [Hahella sp. KA22]QAY54864.1 DUF2797 domain-containing protein [Hahella sp. KA22]